MMKRKRCNYIALALLLCTAAGGAQAETEVMGGKAVVNGEVNAGVQQRVISGAGEKFEEYRDVHQGVQLNDLRLGIHGAGKPYYLDIRVKDPVQDDEYYRVDAGAHGKYNFGLFYDSIPHNFSSGRFLLNDLGGGRFGIPDTIQQQLQNTEVLRSQRLTYDPVTGVPLGLTSTAAGAFINPADAQNQALDAPTASIVSNLYNSANTIRFALKREQTGFNFDYRLFDDVKLWTKVTNEKRIGTRRINQGTYERYNNGVTTALDRGHVADFFVVAGIELPETIDYRTTALNVGTGVYKQNWLADIQYTFTNFDNNIESLLWENPFRTSDATATGAAAISPALVGTANPFNRGRSATGEITLSPDSKSHDFAVAGSLKLPLHTRLSGTISYGWITQGDDFEPYTRNSGITATGTGLLDVTNPANLPQRDLGGRVGTLSQSYQLTTKPVDPLTVTARYRYYDYDNRSDNITFPGYSAFGDSFWRIEKNDVSPGQDAPVRNEALSFTRQNAELGVDFHVMKPLTLTLEGFWEDWDREQLRIENTTEVGAGAGITFKPARVVTVKADYRYAHRSVHGYEPGNTAANPEAAGLINYDWADRERHRGRFGLQVLPTEALTVGVNGSYLQDRFGDENRFGLKKNQNISGGIDAAYVVSEAVSLYANYVREHHKGEMQSAAKDDPFTGTLNALIPPGGAPFNPENYWNSNIYEKVDTVGVGSTIQLIPGKLSLNANYSLSYSDMDVNTYNPNGAVKLLNAAAQDWTTIKNRYQEVKADLGYNFTTNFKAGVTYLFEWYKLDDFVNTPAYMAGASFENSTRYLFTGANYFNYEAHVAAAYVNYRF